MAAARAISGWPDWVSRPASRPCGVLAAASLGWVWTSSGSTRWATSRASRACLTARAASSAWSLPACTSAVQAATSPKMAVRSRSWKAPRPRTLDGTWPEMARTGDWSSLASYSPVSRLVEPGPAIAKQAAGRRVGKAFRRPPGQRVVVVAVPWAAQPAVLDRALAERAALMRAPVLQRAQPRPAPSQRDRAAVYGNAADPALGRDVHRIDPVPAASFHVNASAPIAGRTTLPIQSAKPAGRYVPEMKPARPSAARWRIPALTFRQDGVRPSAVAALIACKRSPADHQETNRGVQPRHRHPRGRRVR
jgi:hypothetical protein